jgi:tRNA threonylcarbamoyl adenosine modification protein YeaZ
MMQTALKDIGAFVRGDDDAQAGVTHGLILQRKIVPQRSFLLHTSSMKCLFIDLASNKGLLALVTEKSVIAAEHIDKRIGDQELMPKVISVLGVGRWAWEDLTHIACVVGPGGFMSLRVAVALANTLADQLKIPIAGMHLSDVYHARMSNEELVMSNYVWVHSTKKTELFVRGFGEYAQTWSVATHVKLEDLLNVLRRDVPFAHLPWVGELIPEHIDTLTSAVGALRAMPLQPVAEILPTFLYHQEFKQQILEPWYGRGW